MLQTTDLSSNTEKPKRRQISFTSVVRKLQREGSSVGFRALRDFLLENFHALKGEFGAANVISLAINCDKHAVFADISAMKGKDSSKERVWRMFQEYLSGKTQTFSLPADGNEEEDNAKAVSVSDPEGEESDDGASGESV